MDQEINQRGLQSREFGNDLPNMMEHSPMGFYTCDKNGLINNYNSAAVLLWGRKPHLGHDYWSGSLKIYFHNGTPMDIENYPSAKVIHTKKSQKSEVQIERPDGSFKNLLIHAWPQYNEQNEFTGVYCTLVDVSQHQKDHMKQALLAAVVDSSDDAIISKDLNGIIKSWNVGAERIFGYSEAETIGEHITMLIPQERLYEEDNIINNIKNGNRVDHIETIRLDKSGREIPLSITVSPVVDPHGIVVGASKVARNISERLKSEEKQSILSAIVESSDDAIISKNLEGIIMSWNRGAENIFGYSEAEAVGNSILMLIPEDRHEEEQLILKKLRKGEKIDHFKTIRKKKSGEKIAISITVSPIKDSRGRIIGASKVARDITLQVKAQKALEKYNKNLEMLNSVGKSISENLDEREILQRVTDATTKLTGASFGAFLKNNFREMSEDQFETFIVSNLSVENFENAGITHFTKLIRSSFKDQQVVRFKDVKEARTYSKIETPYGTCEEFQIVSLMAVPIISKKGRMLGTLVYGHPERGRFTSEHELLVLNIAAQAAVSLENSRLFEQVKSLSDKKDEFIALASHELKTPLTTIKGYLQVLSRKKTDKLTERFLGKALNQVEKLNALIEDILNMSRIEQGRLEIKREAFDLREMLRDIVETFSYSTQSHQIVSNLGNSSAIIEGDQQRIEQAIVNLMTNAIKYSPGAEAIYVNLETIGKNVTVRVRDSGIGLTGEQKEQLFTRFYRAEDTKGISGLGLGLYLTKQIIDLHKGKIEVTSEYGRGSEFFFTLALKKDADRKKKAV